MKKKMPIGISDFKEVILDKYYFFDKSLFINHILNNPSKIILFPRPRRFGKTLNLSMLKYFFDVQEKNQNFFLFKNLAIEKESDSLEHQGAYPVIYLTFKDVKKENWKDCYRDFQLLIADEYKRHKFILEKLTSEDKIYFKSILSLKALQPDYEQALKKLTSFLTIYYKTKVILLIDEYDTPLHAAWLKDYYEPAVSFLRNFLSGGLKDNSNLKKGVLTGILRMARESIFSGLNNLAVSTLIEPELFEKDFGVTEEEIAVAFKEFGLEEKIEMVRSWYNGYVIGNTIVHNPWSVIRYLDSSHKRFMPYWGNTSSNDILRDLLQKSGPQVKEYIEILIQGGAIEKPLKEEVSLRDLWTQSDVLWSVLFYSGYLKSIRHWQDLNGILYCEFKIPNKEVQSIYAENIQFYCGEIWNKKPLSEIVKTLLSENLQTFQEQLENTLENNISFYDQSENFYHGFVLGLLIELKGQYSVRSNRESGDGRYDILLFPLEKMKKAFVIEFKVVNKKRKETRKEALKKALHQIEEKKYDLELLSQGIKKENIIKLAIAFEGKHVALGDGRNEYGI